MKISSKLILLTTLTSSIIILLGWYGALNISQINQSLETVYKDRVVPLQQLKTISDMYAVNIVDATHKMRIRNIDFAQGRRFINDAQLEIEKQWTSYISTELTEKEVELIDEAKTLMATAGESIDKLETIIKKDDSLANAQLVEYISEELYIKIDPITEKIAELVDLQLLVAGSEYHHAKDVYEIMLRNEVWVIALGIAMSLFFSYIIIKGIKSKLSKANEVVSSLSEGNLMLSLEDNNKDEIDTVLKNISTLIRKLREMMSQIEVGASAIASASEQIAEASGKLSEGVTEQASTMEEVSTSIQEISGTIDRNASMADNTEKSVIIAGQQISKGNKIVSETFTSMQEIAERISVMDEISRQINILALNAAVEAARAGVHGKGFAVVAAEVRKLAERSLSSSKEINLFTNASINISEASTRLLADIVPQMEETAGMMKEISKLSEAQNTGAVQITVAVQQLNQLTHENAASSEELAQQLINFPIKLSNS